MTTLLVRILSFAITPALYLLTPLFIIVSGKTYDKQRIRRIAIVNALFVFFIVIIIVGANSGNPSAEVGPAVIWGYISYWLLRKNCLKTPPKQSNPKNHSESSIHICISDINETPPVYGTYHYYSKHASIDTPNIPDNPQASSVTPPNQTIQPSIAKNVSPTKTSKPNTSNIITIILAIALFISLTLNISSYTTTTKTDSNPSIYNEEYFLFYQKNHAKLDFFDKTVVFVEDNGTNLYHKYECSSFIGKTYWAFNVEYANYTGYNPCPQCIN